MPPAHEVKPRFQEFFVEGRDAEQSHVLLHITEPATPEEAAKGYFFALVEIGNGTPKSVNVVQSWIEHIESTYYEGPADNNAAHFEGILERVNRQSNLYLRQHPSEEFHILVGILSGQDLIFGFHGQPSALLFYRGKNAARKRIDIISDEDRDGDAAQLFGNVLSGTVGLEDMVFFSTPHVADFFSPDRLEKILGNRPMDEVHRHIQKTLEEIDSDFSFGGLFIAMPEAPTTAVGTAKGAGLLSGDYNKGQSKEKTMGGSGGGGRHTEKFASTTGAKLRGALGAGGRKLRTIPWVRLGQAALATILALGRGLVHVLSATVHLAVSFFVVVTNQNDARRIVLKQYGDAWRRTKNWVAVHVRSLTLMGKVVAGLIIISAVVIIGGLWWTVQGRAAAQKEAAWVNIRETIEFRRDEAEASIIYRDENKAREQIGQATELLNSLPQEKKKWREEGERLRQSIEAVAVKLRHEIAVAPALFIDVGAASAGFSGSGMMRAGTAFVLWSAESSGVALVSQNDKTITFAAPSSLFPGFIYGSAGDRDVPTVLWSKSGALAELVTNGPQVRGLNVDLPMPDFQPADVEVYNRRLYFLHPESNQILKHDKASGGFGKGNPWITDSSEVRDGVAMTIDGSLWVLKKNGTLIKFDGGKGAIIEPGTVLPELTNPKELWTLPESAWLYMIEEAGNRIVVLDKSGGFRAQYVFPNFGKIQGMSIDEPGRKLYVLSENKIWEAPLSHL